VPGESESIPRGGVSVLGTKTIPFRTSARFIRLRARETHWPASAEVTVALLQKESESFKLNSPKQATIVSPFPVYTFNSSDTIATICVWTKQDGFASFYNPCVDNSIDYSPHIWDRPCLDNRYLVGLKITVFSNQGALTSSGWSTAYFVVSRSLDGNKLRNVRSCRVE